MSNLESYSHLAHFVPVNLLIITCVHLAMVCRIRVLLEEYLKSSIILALTFALKFKFSILCSLGMLGIWFEKYPDNLR